MAIDKQRIVRPFLKIRGTLKDVPANPTPEQVHKLRTRLRRLEAALDALGLDSQRAGRRALRHSKVLRRRTGKIRDMDVLTALARDCGTCRIQLLEYLGAERYRQVRKFHHAVRRNGATLRMELGRCLVQIEDRIGAKASARANVMAAAAMTARILELGGQLAQYPRLGRSNLHQFRVHAKHLRCILQMAGECGTPFFRALDEANHRIGEWHDWERLTEIARSLDGHPGRHAMLAELRAVTKTKFLQAMEVTQQWRDQHLASMLPGSSPAGPRAKPALPAAPIAA